MREEHGREAKPEDGDELTPRRATELVAESVFENPDDGSNEEKEGSSDSPHLYSERFQE